MKRINCYNFIIKDGRVFHRKGIPCEGFYNGNKVIINGLGMYRLFKKPVDIDDNCTTDEEIVSRFNDYSSSDPWVGRESNGSHYLYGANIDKDHLYLKAPSPEKPDTEYVLVRAPMKYEVHVLGSGRIIFRRFDGEDVVALLEINGASMIDLDSDEGLIMIEPLGKGKFVCR